MAQPEMSLQDIEEIVSRVEYEEKEFHVGLIDGDHPYVQIRYQEADVLTGEDAPQHGRKWLVSRFATESEVVQTCLTAALASAEHQVREHFKYQPSGTPAAKAVYGPHFHVRALYGICGDRENFDARDNTVEPGGSETSEVRQKVGGPGGPGDWTANG